jgi:hypothetical protein
MSLVTVAVDNTAPRKVNRPRIGVKHGRPNEAAALRLLRATARAARVQIAASLEYPFSFHSNAHDQAVAQQAEAERFASMAIECAQELDEASLLVLEHALRAMWVTSNRKSR